MRYLLVLLCLSLMLAGTWFAGWVAVPVIAAAYALARRDVRAPREAGVAALVAWVLLLIRLNQHPAFTALLDQLGQIFPVPGIAVVALSLGSAYVLAACAARVVIGVVGINAVAVRKLGAD